MQSEVIVEILVLAIHIFEDKTCSHQSNQSGSGFEFALSSSALQYLMQLCDVLVRLRRGSDVTGTSGFPLSCHTRQRGALLSHQYGVSSQGQSFPVGPWPLQFYLHLTELVNKLFFFQLNDWLPGTGGSKLIAPGELALSKESISHLLIAMVRKRRWWIQKRPRQRGRCGLTPASNRTPHSHPHHFPPRWDGEQKSETCEMK